jgi:hypothetical protein
MKIILFDIMPIPKTVFQSSRELQPQYVIDMIIEKCPGWIYKHFTDKEIMQYFILNPLPEFPFIMNVFHKLKFGAHKADLFRYYFLYNEGGVFIDSDAMIQIGLEEIMHDYPFFSVNSYIDKTVFQGFIGCEPKNQIIYEALKDAYTIDIDVLTQHYHLLTAHMYEIINKSGLEKDVDYILYKELESDGEKAVTINQFGEPILIHYWKDKIVPKPLKKFVRFDNI